jgi:hypothetical protein
MVRRVPLAILPHRPHFNLRFIFFTALIVSAQAESFRPLGIGPGLFAVILVAAVSMPSTNPTRSLCPTRIQIFIVICAALRNHKMAGYCPFQLHNFTLFDASEIIFLAACCTWAAP